MTKKTKTLTAEEIKARKESTELQKHNEKLLQQIEELQKKQAEQPAQPDTAEIVRNLQQKVEMLTSMVSNPPKAEPIINTNQLNFRPASPEDVLSKEDSVTFTARNVMYLIAGYIKNGVEYYPPHKLIFFEFAASDVARDGKEETIKNYCQFTTNLKTEVDYLRSHPLYGITFYDNLNAVMGNDVLNVDFRVQAANTLRSLPPEGVMARAKEFNVFSPDKSVDEMRALVIDRLAKTYVENHSEQQRERLKRNLMVQNSKQ